MTLVYKLSEGEWTVIGELVAEIGNNGDPLIYVREEVVGGIRTFYSSRHEPVENRGPDRRVAVGTAEEIFTEEELRIFPPLNFGTPAELLFGRFDMDDDGVDEVFTAYLSNSVCNELCYPTDFRTLFQGKWFTPVAFMDFLIARLGEDGLPHIYVRDEWRWKYRTYYTSLDGPRRRVPFPTPE